MEEIISKNKCTGCTSCMNICPKKAISMGIGKDGFKYPVINQEKCIDCGLCKKACPVLNTKENKSINKCYVAYNKDKNSRKNKSSSGGIFELIAKEVLKDKGIVIGAAFDKYNNLNHVWIESINELEKLKGSKYLQSNLNDIFSFIKDNIKNKKVLFVGTPCQVAGLKSFLKKEQDNLICIDLICHGVPSPKLFKKYVKELENKYNYKVIDYNFRDKKTGWDTYSNTITLSNKKQISELQKENNFMKLFLSDVALRESCYNCNFKLGNKYSDITLGDFWGVKNYYPKMYNKLGVSAIIINSEVGKNLFKRIEDDIEYLDCDLTEIVKGNPSIKNPCKKPAKRDRFFDDVEQISIEKLVKKYTKKTILLKIVSKLKSIIKRILKK